MAIVKKSVSAPTSCKFTIDCTRPHSDAILDTAAFENFLHDRFKVEGKTGQLADRVEIRLENNGSSIVVEGKDMTYPKRYLKYLTKKFLKKNKLRDWLHVVASDKNTYELRYFNIGQDEEEEEEADDDVEGSDEE